MADWNEKMCYRDALKGCATVMSYGALLDVLWGITGCVTRRTPTKRYWITELVGVFLIILLWFQSKDLLKYLSIVLW